MGLYKRKPRNYEAHYNNIRPKGKKDMDINESKELRNEWITTCKCYDKTRETITVDPINTNIRSRGVDSGPVTIELIGGKWYVVAGYNSTAIDLRDILRWYEENFAVLLVAERLHGRKGNA